MAERINEGDIEFDVIGDVLETLRFRGSIFFRSDLAAPWGMSLDKTDIPRFHIAMSGSCYVGSDSVAPVNMQHMEIVMIPSGSSHWIADQPGRKLVPSQQAGTACELGNPLFQQGEITQSLMCGLVNFDKASKHPILDSLPQVLHFATLTKEDPIWLTVMLIESEMQRNVGKCGIIVDRLTEVLFLQLLYRYVHKNQEVAGFLAALKDRRIHKALTLIHQEPEFNWTITTLGERIGMSPATLVRHFQSSIGLAPMAYVLNWRMMKAYNLIKYSNANLETVAEQVGFSSARTLNKAFQRQYALTPTKLRSDSA
ncbi:MAG: AraC-like DNA-binding protein [Alphaproteobacteria bacterium]